METPQSPSISHPQSPTNETTVPAAKSDANADANVSASITAPSFPPEQPQKQEEQQARSLSPIPLGSALRTHPKRLLPHHLSSTYPHGHLSGHPRSDKAQISFDARRKEILATMTAAQIEKRYEEIAAKVKDELDEAERRGKDVEAEIEKLSVGREMERKLWGRLSGLNDGGK